jgi:hypothetical protein
VSSTDSVEYADQSAISASSGLQALLYWLALHISMSFLYNKHICTFSFVNTQKKCIHTQWYVTFSSILTNIHRSFVLGDPIPIVLSWLSCQTEALQPWLSCQCSAFGKLRSRNSVLSWLDCRCCPVIAARAWLFRPSCSAVVVLAVLSRLLSCRGSPAKVVHWISYSGCPVSAVFSLLSCPSYGTPMSVRVLSLKFVLKE